MTEDNIRYDNAKKIVSSHMVWSMGAGLLPVPIADFFAVSAIQLDMIRQLSKLYDKQFSENETKAIISALTSSIIAKIGARAAVKLIPGLGSVIGGVTMAVLSGASTYAVGETFVKHFEEGGTVLDFDVDRLKKVYDQKFEKGKKFAQDIQKKDEIKKYDRSTIDLSEDGEVEVKKNNIVDQLAKLAELRQSGVLTEEEFEIMKKKVIGA